MTPVDFDGINAAALCNGRSFVESLLPGGKFRSLEYVVKNPCRNDQGPGSFSINYKSGRWKDFATGDGGADLISLFAYLRGVGQSEAAREMADKLGVPVLKSNGSAKPNGSHTNGNHHETSHETEAPQVYPWGNEGPPARSNEIRRHVYSCDGCAMRVKVKLHDGGFVNWYRVFSNGVPIGWKAKKPDDYKPIPYVTSALDPFDSKLIADEILWPEGEKDVDILSKLNLPAFTFGGVGDGLPDGIESCLKDRRLIILSDNDDAGRKHADKKAVLAHEAGAASIKVIHFLELPPKGDVSDFIANGGTVEQLVERIDAAPMWLPQTAPRIPPAYVEADTAPTAWENPNFDILEDSRGNLPEFPTDVFDPKWSEYVERAAHAAGVTAAHVAVPLVGIISGIVGCNHRVKAASAWFEPCSVWSAIVGYSGTGKTPGIDVPKRALVHVEKERRSKIADLQREHETRVESARAAQKEWKRQVEEAIKAGIAPPPRPPAAAAGVGEFIRPRLFISDVTVERAAVLLQARPSGLVLIRDELSGLFANMNRYSNGSDREFWLESWNGTHHVVERVGRDAVVVDHLLFSIVGGLQPDKLARSFEGDDDGMHARIIFAWPSEPDYRPLSNDCAEHEPIIINALNRLIDQLPIKVEGGEFVSGTVELSSNATKTFEQFRQFLHQGRDGLYGREREWWAKGTSHVLRLAGTFAFLSWAAADGEPKPQRIEEKFIEAAIRTWRDYFWPHSRAALRQIGITERHATARRILKWIRANKNADRIISLKDIRRDALGQSLDAEKTERILEQLEQEGWLRKETTSTGGRARHRWQVNDRLFNARALAAESAQSAERGRP